VPPSSREGNFRLPVEQQQTIRADIFGMTVRVVGNGQCPMLAEPTTLWINSSIATYDDGRFTPFLPPHRPTLPATGNVASLTAALLARSESFWHWSARLRISA
jgi:hypothetical protein